MYHLNSNLHSESTKWDTNFARTYLRISEDQLEKLNKIPGWSKVEDTEKISNKNNLGNIEQHLAQQDSPSTENLPTIKRSNFAKNSASKIQSYNSDLELNPKTLTPSTEKEVFLKKVSLSPIKKPYRSSGKSTDSLQRSTSFPDLYEKLLSPRKSSEIYRKRKHSIEKDVPCIELPSLLAKDTYIVPAASDDGINQDNSLKINSSKSMSCPLEYSSQFLKQKKLKTLDDSTILNHKYLKGIVKSIAVPLPSNNTEPTLQQEMSLLGKKLLMLEKRFSPSKEMGNQPITANSLTVENERDKNFVQIPTSVNQVATAEIFDKIQTSSMSKSHESLVLQSNSNLLNEKGDALKNTLKFVQDSLDNVLKTTGCNFESFLSPPVPCGQLAPTDVPTLSQPTSSHQTVEFDTPKTSQIASTPVTDEQPLPTKEFSASQPVKSQKLEKINSSNESQKTELSSKVMAEEKPSGTFSVFSVNSNEKIPDLASTKELGGKRKRKNRSEKSSKKSELKKLKRTDIQFSPSQIKNMVAILKIFHTEF